MVSKHLTLLHYYSPALMLHTIHAPELLSFAYLFRHKRELGKDSAQIYVANSTAGFVFAGVSSKTAALA